jgi:CheY-like chemotaxis protein
VSRTGYGNRTETVENTSPPPTPPARSVLVVDDDRLVRTALLRTLRRLPGLTVTDFADPLEALAHARTNPFHVAILDLQMPEMDGVTLAQEIRSLQPMILLVFMTANLTSELAVRAALLSSRPLIGKPWTTADLRAALDLR